MNKVFCLSLVFFISLSAQASSFYKLVCQEYDRQTEQLLQRTIVIDKTYDAVEEKLIRDGYHVGSKSKYYIELYTSPDFIADETYIGVAELEDVNLDFTSNDGKVEFHTYLDELDQSTLTFKNSNDSEEIYFICR